MRSLENTGGWVALLVSATVHLAFVGWVASRPADHIETKHVTAEFIFVEPTPEPPEPVVEPTPPKPTPPPPKITPPRATPRPPVEVPSKPIETVPSDPLPPRDVPTRIDTPVQDLPRVRLSLVPGSNSSFAVSLDAGIEIAVANQDGLHALEAPKDLVLTITKETLGKGRVDRGLVHPYYSQLGKALLKTWDAERVAANGLKGLAEQTSENFKLYNEIWADKAQAYGKGGNPMGDMTPTSNRRGAVNDRIAGITGVDLEQRKELSKAMREQFKATRRAVIRVVQAQDGKLLKVELVQPSQDAKVDKEALADVRAAAEKLPPPPAEALEHGKTTLSSLWSFELIVSISPPVPTFSFEFDEALGFIDARLPLDRRIYKKVRLVSVE